ncbi:MAG: alpha/beta hydrolase [Proteobacteria bacterium]|nr:alpha/beta hydrolase [Pseudomonadota bacterium]
MSAITQKFFIDGPAGKLEAVLGEPESAPKGIAVIAHPHPLHGGTMDNKVVHTLFTALLKLEFITVKFNFRGVGRSEGSFGQGVGETEDVIAVTQAIRNRFSHQFPEIPLLLAGFSFGGAVQLHAAEKLAPEFLLLVAPSVANLRAPPVPETTQYALIIHGDKDDVVLPEAVLGWAEPAAQPVLIVPGAEHFFHGKLALLKRLVFDHFAHRI